MESSYANYSDYSTNSRSYAYDSQVLHSARLNYLSSIRYPSYPNYPMSSSSSNAASCSLLQSRSDRQSRALFDFMMLTLWVLLLASAAAGLIGLVI